MFQKVVNIIAVASGVVSIAVVCSGLYVYINKDSIVDGVKQQVMDAALGSLGGFGGLAGGGLGGGTLIPEGDSGIGGVGAGAGIVAPPVVPSF